MRARAKRRPSNRSRSKVSTAVGVAFAVVAGLLLVVSPATGSPHDASDFFIFARGELGQFAEADCNGSNDKQADISGSNSVYLGRIHSHSDLAVSGTVNRFSSALTFGTHDEDCQLQAEPQGSPGGYFGGQPGEVDAPPSGLDGHGWPGDLGSHLDPAPLSGTPPHRVTFSSVGQALPRETCDVGDLSGTGVLNLSAANDGQVVCNGTGKVQMNVSGASADSPLVMSVTILSHGPIEISGQNVRLSPAAHDLLAMTDQPSSENDVSIKLAGSNLDVPELAILFSPRSGQDISGSDGSEMCVQLVGQGRIKSAGSNSRFGPGVCRGPRRETSLPRAPAGTFTIDQVFAGLSLTVETNGGLWPSEVEILPAREHMAGRMAGSFVGPAFAIEVPETAPPIQGATLTLPYHEQRLAGTPEGDIGIYTFDEDTQLWVKVPGNQTVDTGANTVTASLAHFSVYAVLKNRTSADWQQIFGNTPVRCVGSEVGIDVVFLVDSSGSMSTNDPQGRRVDGAKQFVDQMRFAQDRAAVVDFDSTARRVIDLTALESEAGRTAVKAALDQTNNASGGTEIGAAVQQAIAILSANGGGGRLRVAILLTDGQSLYNTALTTQAAEQAIEIHTVGLGVGVNETLLRGIATGTGGSYRFLLNADELPALYEELAGDIIGDGTDTDGDTLTDCAERNGLFVPVAATFPFVPAAPDTPSFITTNPAAADTDADGLPDSGPGGELERKSLLDDALLAFEYSFLIDAGLTEYYVMHSNPNEADTDGDGLEDGLERANGTNPLIDDENELGIDGLDLAPFTLFQPARYLPARPVIEQAFLEFMRDDATGLIPATSFNDTPVSYDDDKNCVETCAAILALAAARPDNGLWDWCFGDVGFCDSDASQARDIVDEARARQRVFDNDGLLDEDFLRLNIASQCSLFYADADGDASNGHTPCSDAYDFTFDESRTADQFVEFLAAGTIALPRPGTIPIPNRGTLIGIAGGLIAATGAIALQGISEDELADMLDDCYRGPALRVVGQQLAFAHPCETMPVYSPGGPNMFNPALHRVDAIADNPLFVRQRWASPEQRPLDSWKTNQPGCQADDRARAETQFPGISLACDEFPNAAMIDGGPPAKDTAHPLGTSLRYLPFGENSSEGGAYGRFADTHCRNEVMILRRDFLVVPRPLGPKRTFHCGIK